jgi:hypothetical protein
MNMKNLILTITSIATVLLLALCLFQHQLLEQREMEISDLHRTLVIKQAHINLLNKQ